MNTPIHELERSYGQFPREHQHSTLEQLELGPDNPELVLFLESATKLVTEWTGDQFAGLYLYGEPGTGKTHAAVGLARALNEQGASIHYRHIPTWKPNIRSEDSGFERRTYEVKPHITDWTGPESTFMGTSTTMPFPTSRMIEVGYSHKHVDVHDKSVLILDDYKPFARDYVASAIEAASQYGGLVVVTSNYTDPFKIIEETPQEKQQNAQLDAMAEIVPQIADISSSIKGEQAAQRDALRSRVAAGFRFIRFEGEDRRPQTSFWSD